MEALLVLQRFLKSSPDKYRFFAFIRTFFSDRKSLLHGIFKRSARGTNKEPSTCTEPSRSVFFFAERFHPWCLCSCQSWIGLVVLWLGAHGLHGSDQWACCLCAHTPRFPWVCFLWERRVICVAGGWHGIQTFDFFCRLPWQILIPTRQVLHGILHSSNTSRVPWILKSLYMRRVLLVTLSARGIICQILDGTFKELDVRRTLLSWIKVSSMVS